MPKDSAKILLFFLIMFPCNLQAQPEKDILSSVLGKLADYTSRCTREEVYLHTDREEYVAGEDIWFSAYLFDRKSLRSSAGSSIAYIEILNTENNPVIRRSILLADGVGPGHMILPDTLSTGIYTFRAYTNMMKNFLPYNCFIKEIPVYNALKNERTVVMRNTNVPLLSVPEIQPGTGIGINNTRSDSLELYFNFKIDGSNSDSAVYYLIIHSRGNAVLSGIIGTSEFRKSVSRELLPEGISEAVVFDQRGNLAASRYIYTPVRSFEALEIQVSGSYASREKIDIGPAVVRSLMPLGKTSISVSPFTGDFPPGVDDYLVFGSEFSTESGYFNHNVLMGLSEHQRDSVLLRLKSNWIRWERVLTGDVPKPEYLPETKDHFIYGFIPGGKGDTVLMCSLSSGPAFRYTRADTDGNFLFSIHAAEAPGDLILISQNGSSEARPVLNSSFSDRYYNYKSRDSIGINPSRFARMAVDYQVRRLFNTRMAGNKISFNGEIQENARTFGKPDLEIKLSDYIELPTMDEVFLELVPGVSLRRGKNGYEVRMADRINDRRIELDPTLMIDGVPVRDASLIAGLDPSLVDRIEITSQKYLVGDYLFNGIVNVATKAADFSCIAMPEYMTRIKYAPSDTVPQFLSPDYSSGDSRRSRIPDYRNTLYWNPSFSSSASFWTCDHRMKYLISIEGITADGRPVSGRKVFEVK